jgi:hypothetical protein
MIAKLFFRKRSFYLHIRVLIVFFLFHFIIIIQISKAHDYTTDPTSYILNKFESHDVVFLGTSHQQPRILGFLSNLMPHLHKAGVTHICLEIHSDQQANLDHYILSGQGLSKIEL